MRVLDVFSIKIRTYDTVLLATLVKLTVLGSSILALSEKSNLYSFNGPF